MTPTRDRPHRASAERRRDALLRAAMEIVAESGTTAATHRAIAARAGVPLSTTSYFFSSMNELLDEATRRFTSDRAAELDAVSRALPGQATGDEIAALFAEVLLTGDRAMELAQIEAYLHAARSSHLRDAVAESMNAFERAAETALSAAGARRPREGARAFMAMVDGFVLEHLARPDEHDQLVLTDALRSLFIAYAMDDAERASWDRRLATRQTEKSTAR
jgi:DNA-binding transcriptional regulator YbjK